MRLKSNSIQSIDEYVDIPDLPSKVLKIRVTQSNYNAAEDEEKSGFPDQRNNSFLSMTTFDRQNSLKSTETTTTLSTNISTTGTEMSAIETYDTNIHGGGLKRVLSPLSEASSEL